MNAACTKGTDSGYLNANTCTRIHITQVHGTVHVHVMYALHFCIKNPRISYLVHVSCISDLSISYA